MVDGWKQPTTNERRREETLQERSFFLIANSHLNFFIRKNETYI